MEKQIIKNNKQFTKVAVEEVKLLNGSETSISSIESWKAGYNYLREIIEHSMNNDYNDEFIDKMNEIIEVELDEFDLDYKIELIRKNK